MRTLTPYQHAKGHSDYNRGPDSPKKISIAFDHDTFAAIAALADAGGFSFAAVVRQLCENALIDGGIE